MPWGAAIAAVGSLGAAAIGSSKGSNSTTGQSVQDTSHTPWAPQGNDIAAALGGATDVYAARTAQGPYTGDLYAQANPYQNAAEHKATEYADNMGQGVMGQMTGTAGTGMSGMGAYMGNAAGTAANGLGTTADPRLTGALSNIGSGAQSVVQQPLSASLHSAATAGANSIGSFNSGIAGVMGSAQQDSTGQIVGDAQQYMNNGATQSMLDNVNNQIDTTLNESTVPGLNRQAAMGGSLNSSRAGMAEAMANRDAALAKGNADSQIMNNAYNTGVSTAASQHTAGLNTALAAGTAGLTGNSNLALGTGNQDVSSTATQIGAATAGLGQATTRDTANTAAQIAGNAQLGSGVTTGLTAGQAAQAQAAGNAKLLSDAGTLQQTTDQAAMNNDYAKWQQANQYQQGVLNDYMTNVTKPTGYYDSSTSSKNTNTPASSLPTLLAGGATALGSQFAPGGMFNSTNKDGTPNPNYVGSSNTGAFDGSGYTVGGSGAPTFDAGLYAFGGSPSA